MTSSVMVNFVCLLSKTHIEQGRYALSFDVALTKKTESVKKTRKAEEQVYVEHDCIAGACSPETELQLQNGRCEIEFVISGALEPTLPLEKGERTVEYNETMSECRKFLSLKPTYVASTEGNATIKFKVSGVVKHTVNIHDVPTAKLELEGTIREETVTASGCGLPSVNVDAVPVSSRELDDMMDDMALGNGDSSQRDQNRTAYDLLLSDKSLMTLAWAMPHRDAYMLLIGLGVPDQVCEHSKENDKHSVILSNFKSFLHWRNERSSRRQMPEASNQHLYEDLLRELGDIGRNDIKTTIEKTYEENRKLEKKDFKHF